MRTFRGKPVIGWKVVTDAYRCDKTLDDMLNDLMDKFEFVDCQYSTSHNAIGKEIHSALVLLGEKQ